MFGPPGVPSSPMGNRYRSACTVSERAKLYSAGSRRLAAGRKCILRAVCCVLPALFAACAGDRVSPVYDAASAIRRIDYDTNRDGQIDMRAYLENGRTVRIEADGNDDGVIDRWEYYRPDGQLDRLGTSSEADGIEDTWVAQNGSQMRVDVATRRDGVVDRHEFHDNGVLVRAEQDSNGDGRIDQWQRFEGGKLRELLLDTTQSSGRPDERLVYAANG